MRHEKPEGTRAGIGLFGGSPRMALGLLLLLGVASAGLASPEPVRAANVLSNPVVTPQSGSTQTTFTFRVTYSSTTGQDAVSVVANVAGADLALTLTSGDPDDGTWSGSRRLPGGSWPVIFSAVSQGPDPASIAGPTVNVSGPTPTPVPTAPPTPQPTPKRTPRPTVRPTPTTAATPRPTAGSTPRPSTPSPGETPGATPPSTPGASQATSGSGLASPTSSQGSPSGNASQTADSSPTGTPLSSAISPPATPTDSNSSSSDAGRAPWLLLGGGLAASGVAVLAVQFSSWRARRRAANDIGPGSP